MSHAMTATGYAERSLASRTPALFGRVMALVAVTVGFATLGVWLARNSGGAEWFIAWLLALGCLIGLNVANARGNRGLAVALLLAFGLLTGASVATTVNYYAATDPTAVRQAFGATALFVGALGLDFRGSEAGCGPCVLDFLDLCWCGGETLSWVILRGDDHPAELGEHVGERRCCLGEVPGRARAVLGDDVGVMA